MAKISYNKVFDAVSKAIKGVFPDSKVHGDTVKSNLYAGDFVVLPIKPSQHGQMGERASRDIIFDVMYFPCENDPRVECLNVCEKLIQALKRITTQDGDIIHGQDLDFNIVDDVLHIKAKFPHFVFDGRQEKEPMSQLQQF